MLIGQNRNRENLVYSTYDEKAKNMLEEREREQAEIQEELDRIEMDEHEHYLYNGGYPSPSYDDEYCDDYYYDDYYEDYV